jgi:adenosylhomocysteinase
MAKYDVKDLSLAAAGVKRIEWADRDMPVLAAIRRRFEKERPLEGLVMAACLHITTETANLARTLVAGGARLALCASNPLSTQDEAAAALVKAFKIPVFAIKGEDGKTYYDHIHAVLACEPRITMDDGADLVSTIHQSYPALLGRVFGSMEETTTGVIRLRAMATDGALKFPVIAVNDAATKHLFDNRYGTGQSTIDGILRATNLLLAGSTVVVAGYGWCGRGVATRARGMGAHVIVCEVDPIRALEAVMDGFQVMPLAEAAPLGQLFITLTGDTDVIRPEHVRRMRDGAILANSGHFNVEIDIPGLRTLAVRVRKDVRPMVDEYVMRNGRRVYLLADGRLINLASAEGHPACVMDMSFAVQALATEWVVKHHTELGPRVYDVPKEIDEYVSRLKLKTMGVGIDTLTAKQRKYLASWQEGT